ncbi:sulfate permease [Gonapodya prolifera JEL478]|uniref:Sulfate permease n=1 Tax=Gonapodya prolifera (strain JEL478) TaxID=1344416 RepID=A0A139A9M6_GONPJ|nr:sulfate permease [Gonapodya prolifera JEL478]|eukprot:KXS13369.1 sulfate permease [Gonapodya prolifera JEL478]
MASTTDPAITSHAVEVESQPLRRPQSVASRGGSDEWDFDTLDEFKSVSKRAVRRIPGAAQRYVWNLFPILSWLPHYVPAWAPSDVLAGFTIGMVVVPQSLAYAKVAQLPPEYGLYSSFIGVIIYSFFATSKDMTIGPTAVMALTVGQVINRVNSDQSLSNVVVATAFSLLGGILMLAIGLFRLGFIVDFIPLSVISGFTTGGAITVIIGQIPALFGITGVDTRQDDWRVIRDIFGALSRIQWRDTLVGLISAFTLYVHLLPSLLAKRYGTRHRGWWYLGVSRNALVAVLATLISFLINRASPKSPQFAILKDVPSGFSYIKVPDLSVIPKVSDGLPVIVLLALLEHIAIAKSFGRINGYKINPSQEVVAIGVTNIAASFFGAFPSTGSFSRTAIKSQSGVKTPLAGLVTAAVVILAIFVLAPTFYYIPNAALAAIIMHGVAELFSPPSHFIRLFHMNKLDFVTSAVTIVLTVVLTVEIGIEVGCAIAVVFLLWRLAKPKYQILAKAAGSQRYYVPLRDPHHHDTAIPPPPGVLIFRPDESLTYPNASFFRDHIFDVIVSTTRKASDDGNRYEQNWSDIAVRDRAQVRSVPRLNTIVLDFSAVNHIDATGVQMVLDLKLDAARWVSNT